MSQTEPTMIVVVGGRPGRPRRFDGTPVSVRLPKALHDALSLEAIQRDKDLSDVIRERLAVGFRISKLPNH